MVENDRNHTSNWEDLRVLLAVSRGASFLAAGRALGLATSTPAVVDVVEDLLTPESGLAIAERPVESSEEGGSPRHLADIVLGVVRDGVLYRVDSAHVDAIEPGDRLLYVRKVTPADQNE